jgi:poly(hydroxyalkanoate) depolymerase family esterase
MNRFGPRNKRFFVYCLATAVMPVSAALILIGSCQNAAPAVMPDPAAMTKHTDYFTSKSVTSDLYMPPSYNGTAPIPLMVMIHGCGQTKSDFMTATLMNNVAQAKGFATLYIDGAVNAIGCWEYWSAKTQSRTAQVNEGIANIVNKVKKDYKIDNGNVWIGGVSSGAVMAVNMAATYPDLFSGAVIEAGLPFGNGASTSPTITAADSAARVLEAMGNYKRLIKVLVFHGDSDAMVPPDSSDRIASAFATVFQAINPNVVVPATPTSTSGTAGSTNHTRYTYATLDGEELVVYYKVDGLGHGWMGGSGSNFSFPVEGGAPDSNLIAYEFFYKPTQ